MVVKENKVMLVMVILYIDGGDWGEMIRGEVDEDMNYVGWLEGKKRIM